VFVFSVVTPLLHIVARLLVCLPENVSKLRWKRKPRHDHANRSVVKSPAFTPDLHGNFSDSFVLRMLEAGLHKRNHILVINLHTIRSRAKLMQIFSVFLNLHV